MISLKKIFKKKLNEVKYYRFKDKHFGPTYYKVQGGFVYLYEGKRWRETALSLNDLKTYRIDLDKISKKELFIEIL